MIVISLGSNLGDRKNHLQKATLEIEKKVGSILYQSKIYETPAWGTSVVETFDYLNMVIGIKSHLPPLELLDKILAIEHQLGRERSTTNAPRTIDIDVLFFDQMLICSQRLQVPHPRLHKRNFVLKPMLDFAPNFIHPIFNLSIEQLYQNSSDQSEITIYND